MSDILVETKFLGRRALSLPSFSLPFPEEWRVIPDQVTLGDLVSRIVLEEVAAFRERQAERRLYRVLTAREIEQAASTGKVTMGGQDLDQQVDEEAAVSTALQAFEDGFYLVFVNEQQVTSLEDIVLLGDDTRVTFVRLTLLAGG